LEAQLPACYALAMPPIEPCPHRPPCPGCPRYGDPDIAPAARTLLDAIAREAGLASPQVTVGAPFGYRHRARLMLRGRARSPKIGIFEAGTHDVVDIPRCRVHHPLVNVVAAALREAIRATGTRPYSERTHTGVLRAVQIVIERASQTAQVVLVANATEPDSIAELANALADRLGERLHSLWWNGNPERSNTILGSSWQHLRGPDAVCESVCGAQVFFPPGAFGQSHLELADALVARVHEWVPDGARVAEYYAGCGPIGLGLLRRATRVVFVESAPDAVRGLAMGIAARPEREQQRAAVIAGSAGEALEAREGAQVVIVDPPRRGLDASLATRLAADPPPVLIYVSCDLQSFHRDAAQLVAGGHARLVAFEAWSLFPNTEHVETLARFERC
jgi:tRNA/tmRNA/rRNA uracil-C5-methylase (TrmA/RlmC/RlmD family)